MISSFESLRVEVDYGLPSAGQLRLVGSREDVRRLEQQAPAWEAINVSHKGVTHLNVRLVTSSSIRSSVPAMYGWIARRGVRPTIFCETTVTRQAMKYIGDKRDLVCAGSLWEVDGQYYYACWHDGEVHLYPISRPFGPDFVCPIAMGSISSPPPETAGAASL